MMSHQATSTQVARAKEKGWIPMCWSEDALKWVEYEGSDPTGLASPLGETGKGAIYDLQGRKVTNPQKGINIIRYSDGTTRMVLVK